MNLKTVHFVFILASALVAFLLAGWEFSNYRALPDITALIGSIAAAVIGIALLIYSVIFWRKARRLIL